jgi:RNA polymerase sigma-70 factor (ECF subfamily)
MPGSPTNGTLLDMSAVQQPDPVIEKLGAILQAVARGDNDAFTELYRCTSSRLFGVCVRMLPQRSDAEDVLQEVFVTIWNKASGYDVSRANPMGWLLSIARSKAIDRLRSFKRDRRNTPLDLEAPLVDNAPSVVDAAEASDERHRLDQCLGTLENRQRAAIHEAFLDGLSHSDLAERWSVPLGTMKSWIRRGLTQLRMCLEQ